MSDSNLDSLWTIVDALRHRFPDGNDPFQAITRLAEECGELAREVNRMENSGIKHAKHGPPEKAYLAREVKDCLGAAPQLVRLYGIEEEFRQAFATSQTKAEALLAQNG